MRAGGGGTRGIITIYCDHPGYHNTRTSYVSEELHILYGHCSAHVIGLRAQHSGRGGGRYE
jgi:hypothetical protein